MPIEFVDINDIPMYEADYWIGHGDSGRVGGNPFREVRDAPYALVGFTVRHGGLIDAAIPLFRELKDDGNLGELLFGGHYGGWGGDETRIELRGYVVVGLLLRQAQFTDQLAIIWHRWTAAGIAIDEENISYTLGGGGGFSKDPIKALPGHCAIGIHGKCGSLVDRISLITARPVK